MRMHRRIFAAPAFLLLFLGVSCARFGEVPPPPVREAPDAMQLRKDVEFLASPTLEGRGLGSEGLEKAARYLLQRYSQLGLDPPTQGGAYFERFEATIAVRAGVRTTLGFAKGKPQTPQAGPGETVVFASVGEDFMPASFSSEGDFSADVAFAGYCATGGGYDDFHGIDVKEKAVICLRGIAPALKKNAPLANQTSSDRYKSFNAREHGAAAVFLVASGPTARKKSALPPITPSPMQSEVGIPVNYLSRTLAERLFTLAGVGKLSVIEKRMSRTGESAAVDLKWIETGGQVEMIREAKPQPNVIGVLKAPGGASECVVVGAHYDHLGYGGEGSLVPGEHAIHPGADDNASGVAALLETARLLSAEKDKLKRNVVFIAFAAEEAGLLGSAAFFKGQVHGEIGRIVAMVNFDMVGRLEKKKPNLTLFGVKSAREFGPYLKKLAEEEGLPFDLSGESYGPSDQTSFLAHEIPSVHFFTGAHSDYHRPSDTAEKLNYEGEARVVQLASRFVLGLASDPGRPRFEVEGQVAHPAVPGEEPGPGAPGYGPYFGSVPDFGAVEGGGVRFAAIRPGSPADKAGIHVGDILVKFGDQEIRNLYDFTYALRQHVPGDEVEVYVRRGADIRKARVRLEERP